jgi:hypothetical protein
MSCINTFYTGVCLPAWAINMWALLSETSSLFFRNEDEDWPGPTQLSGLGKLLA